MLSNIGRGTHDTPSQRVGGMRELPMAAIPAAHNRHQRLVEISKATSGALRRHPPPGMGEEGWVAIKVEWACRSSWRYALQRATPG